MSEKWEFCILSQDNSKSSVIFTGTSVEKFNVYDFVKNKGEKSSFLGPSIVELAIPYFLNEGWEPFQFNMGTYFFRRKISS